jgi:hypothetical protein
LKINHRLYVVIFWMLDSKINFNSLVVLKNSMWSKYELTLN